MTQVPALSAAAQRLVAEIARETALRAVNGRAVGQLYPGTVVSYDPTSLRAVVLVDGDDASVSLSVLSDGFDWYSPNDRVMVQFDPPAGGYVVGRIGPSNSALIVHDDFIQAQTAWAANVGLGDTPWSYTLGGHATVPFGGTGTGFLNNGYAGAIALQTGGTTAFWTQIRKAANLGTVPLPGYSLRFRGRFATDGAATFIQAQAGVGDTRTNVSPTVTGFYWRIVETSGGTPVFRLVSTAASTTTTVTATSAGTPVNKTMYDFVIEWKPSTFVRGWIGTPSGWFGPYSITTNVPAAGALVNLLFGSVYPYSNSVRYQVIDYLRLERCASLT